jgi:PIN domain nuclease of toxin-antitoxin system
LKLLLDTHAAIWAVAQSHLLPPKVREAILATPDQVHVSSATIFEIATKHKLGRSDSPPFGGQDAIGYFQAMGFQLLPVTPLHAATIDRLGSHHRDPFDRLLVAQAIAEPMYLVSRDPLIALYDCPRIPWE